jgi:hypothetical protein
MQGLTVKELRQLLKGIKGNAKIENRMMYHPKDSFTENTLDIDLYYGTIMHRGDKKITKVCFWIEE